MIRTLRDNRRRRLQLRLVEQNRQASTYLEDLAAELGEPDLARAAHKLNDDIQVVQFCVEDSGELDPATERQQIKINQGLRQGFQELKDYVATSFDALFSPNGGWDRYYRTRGL